MSYTRKEQFPVSFVKYETVSYPPSEHGGEMTVRVTGEEIVDLTILVDTEPFDASVTNVNGSLLWVAGAVTTAEAAQIDQINKSCVQITDATLGGFYSVLGSEISASISQQSSRVKATSALLMQQAASVARVQDTMQQDYQRIKLHYSKLFDQLDKEMQRQILELDREAFRLRLEVMNKLVDAPFEQEAAVAVVCMVEQDEMQMKMASARTKGFVASSLNVLASLCAYIKHYTESVDGVTEPGLEGVAQEGHLLIPVVYIARQDFRSDDVRLVVLGDFAGDDTVRKGVLSGISMKKKDLWTEPHEGDSDEIGAAFDELLSDYRNGAGSSDNIAVRERVCREIERLRADSAPATLYA